MVTPGGWNTEFKHSNLSRFGLCFFEVIERRAFFLLVCVPEGGGLNLCPWLRTCLYGYELMLRGRAQARIQIGLTTASNQTPKLSS